MCASAFSVISVITQWKSIGGGVLNVPTLLQWPRGVQNTWTEPLRRPSAPIFSCHDSVISEYPDQNYDLPIGLYREEFRPAKPNWTGWRNWGEAKESVSLQATWLVGISSEKFFLNIQLLFFFRVPSKGGVFREVNITIFRLYHL